ncbi:MAG: response regulator [Alphaproteobacteria bacterium]|nr:response regulator [Alphaproteobacteria bacterium]
MNTNARRLLLVEDDPVMGGSLVQRFNLEGFDVSWAKTGAEGVSALRRFQPQVIISDIRLPDVSGETLINDMTMSTGAQIFFITAFADLEQAVRLVKAGATDYIQKPFSVDKLVDRLREVFERAETIGVHRSDFAAFELSPVMRAVGDTLKRVADTDVPVLIMGETGVGKDLAAHFLHESGRRRDNPFVPVNCGAIPADLIESVMFGHEKGAFAGALTRHTGFFEEAGEGTLLLDEIGDLHPQVQASLLRVVQEGTFRRVGGHDNLTFSGRIVSATNSDLSQRVAAKQFREDLYFRLAVVEVLIPALRHRSAEIVPLAEYFLAQASARFGKAREALSEELKEALIGYHWPGNVRELKNRIERAVALSEGGQIEVDDVFANVRREELAAPARSVLSRVRRDAELQEIEHALAETGGRISEAARRLGISRTTLWKRMKASRVSGRGQGS